MNDKKFAVVIDERPGLTREEIAQLRAMFVPKGWTVVVDPAAQMSKAARGEPRVFAAIDEADFYSAKDPCSSTLFSHLRRSALDGRSGGSWGIGTFATCCVCSAEMVILTTTYNVAVANEKGEFTRGTVCPTCEPSARVLIETNTGRFVDGKLVPAPVCGVHPSRGQRLMAYSGEELVASGREHCSLDDGHSGGHANKAIGRCGVWWSTEPDPFQCAACGGHVGADLDEHAHVIVSKESAMSSGRYEHERRTVCGPCSKLSPEEREKKARGRATYSEHLARAGVALLPSSTEIMVINPTKPEPRPLYATIERRGPMGQVGSAPRGLDQPQEASTFQALAAELAADVPGVCSAVRWKAVVNVVLADYAERAKGKLTRRRRRVAQQEVNGLRDVMPFYATRRFVHRYSHAEALRDTMQAHEGYATRDLARICLAYDRAE